MNKGIVQEIKPTEWVEKYGDHLYNYAITRVHNEEIARDIVQETFLSALKSKDSFQGKSSERTWLFSILKRKVVDYYRKKSSSKEQAYLERPIDYSNENSPFLDEGPLNGNWKADRTPLIWGEDDLNFENTEFYEILKQCLSLLAPKCAATFTMKVIDEMDSSDICKEMSISSSNLWVLLHRARLQLRECLEKNWIVT